MLRFLFSCLTSSLLFNFSFTMVLLKILFVFMVKVWWLEHPGSMSVGIIAIAFWASTVSHENTESLESVKCRVHLYLFIWVVNIHIHFYLPVFVKSGEGLKMFIIITIDLRRYVSIVTIREYKLNFSNWCRWNWKRPSIIQSNSFDLVR